MLGIHESTVSRTGDLELRGVIGGVATALTLDRRLRSRESSSDRHLHRNRIEKRGQLPCAAGVFVVPGKVAPGKTKMGVIRDNIVVLQF